jgi:hypothetical protein
MRISAGVTAAGEYAIATVQLPIAAHPKARAFVEVVAFNSRMAGQAAAAHFGWVVAFDEVDILSLELDS